VTQFLSEVKFSYIYGDMCCRETLDRALEGVTDVVLLAGLVGDPITKKYPEASKAINNEGVLRCIDSFAGRGLERVIFVSTCSNYGMLQPNELADETFPLGPLSLYANAKVAAEKYLLSLREHVDYSPTVLRFATAFGLSSRMRFDLTINEFTRQLALGHELTVFDAHTWRPYCHVKDFARLINTVLEAPRDVVDFEVFNAGGEVNNLTKQDVVDLIRKHIPNAKVRNQEHGGDPRNYKVNFQKVKKALGFEPEITVEEGVVELLNAINQHVFDLADMQRNFHGNYVIKYPLV